MRARNAHKRSTYARVSKDQAAIDEFYKQHGAKEAENTGKVFGFNNRHKRSVGHDHYRKNQAALTNNGLRADQ